MTARIPGDDDNSPAITAGPTTGIGRRNAYHDVVKSQWQSYGTCNITLFSLLSSYSITKHKELAKAKPGPPQSTALEILLEVDNSGKVKELHFQRKTSKCLIET